jgi:hypothetical protein
MKNYLKMIAALLVLSILVVGCTETESNDQQVTAITLSSEKTTMTAGTLADFTVISNLGTNLNSETVFYVNDEPITGSQYQFQEAKDYEVKAVYNGISSNVMRVTIENQYVNRVLVEEYSGTWCGNCPRILYGTQLVKKQTDKAVSVQIHLFNGDPFITSQGNALATQQNVGGVPTGKINRTINWNGPQYQNVKQVTDQIKTSASVGLAINTAITGNELDINVLLGYANTSINSKLVVYLVEDDLFSTQANYSSNLYGGKSSIPNFEYDGVLRAVVSSNAGDAITVTGNQVQKNYKITIPSNISNICNAKVVAFLVGSNGSVLNVRESNTELNQALEIIQ